MTVGRAYMPSVAETVEWETPQALFDVWAGRFAFTLDVCATPENAKVPRFYTEQQDGLAQDWSGEICWMNPPYGPALRDWMRKAYTESLRGATVVCLVPSRTDTRWWHEYAEKGERHFIKGRLKFGGHKNSAPFPSAIVVFRPLDLQAVA